MTEELVRKYLTILYNTGKWPDKMKNEKNVNFSKSTLKSLKTWVLSDGGICPESISGKELEFIDQETQKKWFLRLFVRQIEKDQFEAEKSKSLPDYTHLLVYLNNQSANASSATTHCVYAKELVKINIINSIVSIV